jgi:putative redox protein
LLKINSELARKACGKGYVSILFDFRGVGRSTGKFDYGIGEQQDVKYALNYALLRKDVIRNEVFVVGHSLGGAVALYALQGASDVEGLVLWSVPKNHDYNVKKFIRKTKGRLGLFAFLLMSRIDRLFDVSRLFQLQVYGINLRPRFVREKLMKLNECEATSRLKSMRILVVNGEDDEIVGVDEAREVYESAKVPKTLLIIKSADHIYRNREDELVNKTLEWIADPRNVN